MTELRFYFDVVCPYAYLASTQVERIAAAAGATLAWRPMLLGGLFRLIGTATDAGGRLPMPAAKVRMNALDLDRWARRWQVPLAFPAGHPRRTVDAMRACAAASLRDPAHLPALAHDLFRAYWVFGRDLADRAVLDEIAGRHGLAGAADDEAAKAALRDATDEAHRAGAFGAPTFVVVRGGKQHLFWGQDRLHFVEKALAGWDPPA